MNQQTWEFRIAVVQHLIKLPSCSVKLLQCVHCCVSICILLLVQFDVVHCAHDVFICIVQKFQQGSVVSNWIWQTVHLQETMIAILDTCQQLSYNPPKNICRLFFAHTFLIFLSCMNGHFMRHGNYITISWLKIGWWPLPFSYVAKMASIVSEKCAALYTQYFDHFESSIQAS